MYKTAQKHRLTKEQKAQVINWVRQQLENSNCIIFTNFERLTVAQSNKLRNELRKLKSVYKVIKNQLIKKALAEVQLEELQRYINRNVGIMICTDESSIVPAIKYLVDYSKENSQLKILAGYVYKTIVDRNRVEEIAKLPSREEIVAKLVGLLTMPIHRLYSVLKSPLVSLLNILQTKSQQ